MHFSKFRWMYFLLERSFFLWRHMVVVSANSTRTHEIDWKNTKTVTSNQVYFKERKFSEALAIKKRPKNCNRNCGIFIPDIYNCMIYKSKKNTDYFFRFLWITILVEFSHREMDFRFGWTWYDSVCNVPFVLFLQIKGIL